LAGRVVSSDDSAGADRAAAVEDLQGAQIGKIHGPGFRRWLSGRIIVQKQDKIADFNLLRSWSCGRTITR
jgi:hypothetical protein